MYHELNPSIRARFIRFIPQEWVGHISMRVELYGCQGIGGFFYPFARFRMLHEIFNLALLYLFFLVW